MPLTQSLAAALAPYVGASIRARGERYFHHNRVSIVGASRTRYAASVRGTRLYDVLLTLEGTALVASCTCPHFASSVGACKHIWAAILAVSATGPLDLPTHLWLDASGAAPRRAHEVPVVEPWRVLLAEVAAGGDAAVLPRSPLGEIVYVADLDRREANHALSLELMMRTRRKTGEWGKPKLLQLWRTEVDTLVDARDVAILQRLAGAQPSAELSAYASRHGLAEVLSLPPVLQRDMVPQLCETGRFLLRVRATSGRRTDATYLPIAWDTTPATFTLRVDETAEGYLVDGTLTRGDEPMPLADVAWLGESLLIWRPGARGPAPTAAPLDSGGAGRWLDALRRSGPVSVPATAGSSLAEALAASDLSRVSCPPALQTTARSSPPARSIRFGVRASERRRWSTTPADRLDVDVAFGYGSVDVDARSPQRIVFDPAGQIAWRRDLEAERAALARVEGLGVRRLADWERGGTRFDVAASMVPEIARTLIGEGWHVEAEGHRYVRAGRFDLEVRSGIDWFELRGAVDFDGRRVDVPTLLEAARRRDGLVQLGDGTFGVLPGEWLRDVARVAALGSTEGDGVRFARSQAPILDAWVDAAPHVDVDEAFARVRAELAQFDRIEAVEPPRGFGGVLRPYQREALGWFAFLRRFGFGGCLADEMGLGKTVMVLAALEARRREREDAGQPAVPSLVVVPRSLVFNWTREAARFAPAMRVLDFTGADRRASVDALADSDLVITTYGTLRRDAALLASRVFDYVILDEAQAIKNRASHTARAAKILRGTHRLALSGTPVENHIGELWSLFEFLNPGMLGSLRAFGDEAGAPGEAALALVARGVRPFILRRTKEQVAADLPARSEQTILCDLEPKQRAVYDELRDHYRSLLLGRIDAEGMNRAKLQVLEALLRLRQAACHPGLVDPRRADGPSAKLDLLVPRLEELVEDGRKVLVFSQFTTLLALLRPRLEAAGLDFEYLDGRTRDRQARVDRFQRADGPRIFLISLKAGGVGLNLTAADHVFLLDPWWNPAVEAQAIDRAHRIGQTRRVFAVRLIARDTVEEKVLELQASKRALADLIVRADERLVRDLRREDLDLLLS